MAWNELSHLPRPVRTNGRPLLHPEFGRWVIANRNRSQGWAHAKLSGHRLEEFLAHQLQSDTTLSSQLHSACYGSPEARPASASTGGMNASMVPCVLGGLTTSKVDLVVHWPNHRSARISIKKSASGQVWLVSKDRFLEGYAAQFGTRASVAAGHGLHWFIGPLDENDWQTGLKGAAPCGPLHKRTGIPLEHHQTRLVARTLERHLPEVWAETLQWMRSSLPNIAELCFARGLGLASADWAEFIWYPIVGDPTGSVDASRIFKISSIVECVAALPVQSRVSVGPRSGGSTLILPYGFLQMHRPTGGNEMQFHHKLRSIQSLLTA